MPRSDFLVTGWVCLLLAGLVAAVFGQTGRFEFVNWDDPFYITSNPRVKAGLSGANLIWAFTHTHANNWHPLTTLMHMLNCSLFGINPGGHHLFNVALHAVTTVLLFLVLKNALGFFWPSAWVAAVFAVHPLHVESVAWISELKDVLMAFFFVLTIGSYVRYARKPFSLGRYSPVLLCFFLGLLCKPMLVTVPFVLCLLDLWPLKRLGGSPAAAPSVRRLVLEKLPLLLLSAGASFATLLAQRGVFTAPEALTLPLRIENALFAYATYLGQTLCPWCLSAFYPFPEVAPPSWQTLLLLLVLGAFTALTVHFRGRWPWLLVGWCWFVGMLIPVVGLVQVGQQSHADRYMYLPQLGVLIILAMACCDLTKLAPLSARLIMSGLAVLSVIFFACFAWFQTRQWRNAEALWTHAIKCNPENAEAYAQFGSALARERKPGEAVIPYRRALELEPSAKAHSNLATVLQLLGHYREAARHYRLADQFEPGNRTVYLNWGGLLFRQGDLQGALRVYRGALKMFPNDAEIHNDIGQTLGQQNQFNQAAAEFKYALSVQPAHLRALIGLRETLRALGREKEAIPFLAQGGAAAAALDDRTKILRLLAETYARTGNPKDARATGEQALAAAQKSGDPALIHSTQEWLKAFTVGLRQNPQLENP